MTSSQEYAEKLSEDPSQFYDDEPKESKVAAVKVEESDEVKKLRAALAAAQLDAANAKTEAANAKTEAANAKAEVIAVKSAKKKRAPKGLYKAQCDDTMKNIQPTIDYIATKHKGNHREMYMLGLFVKDFADALSESDDHDAFKKWLTDNKESLGLKKMTRKATNASTDTSLNTSLNQTNETIEESMDEDEDEEDDDDEGVGAA